MHINDENKYFGAAQIGIRKHSVNQIINFCLNSKIEEAPYLALMYCFATVDLMGAYLTGRFNERKETDNAFQFINKYIGYSREQTLLLQEIYRHKLVHTGLPTSFFKHNEEVFTWTIHYDNRNFHLKITENGQARCFNISIRDFGQDLINGMIKYLDELEVNDCLKQKYKKTLHELWGLNLIQEQNKV